MSRVAPPPPPPPPPPCISPGIHGVSTPSPLLYNLATGNRVHLAPSAPSGQTLLAVSEGPWPSPGVSGVVSPNRAAATPVRDISSAPPVLPRLKAKLERHREVAGFAAGSASSLPPTPRRPTNKGVFRRSCSVGDTTFQEKATATLPSEAAVMAEFASSNELQRRSNGVNGETAPRGSFVEGGLTEPTRAHGRRRERSGMRAAECRLACRALSYAARRVLMDAFWKWKSRAAKIALQLDKEEQRSRASRQVRVLRLVGSAKTTNVY